MKNAYVTKRIAPKGYVAVTKQLAELLYNQDVTVTMCGNNVNSYHVFEGWCLGYTFNKRGITERSAYEWTFTRIVNNFMFYLEKELGTYPVFYVQSTGVKHLTKETKHGKP